ncbi:MAG: glycosyltransferase, partial [Candidatus Kerfeldbacteria bacterium]|nr:glycosyltransferase [Candidatus Kerfeldbacteria bacterium]
HLPSCLESIREQTLQPHSILIVDNASVDGTVEWLREEWPHVHLLRNTRNMGFGRAHNQALRIGQQAYVLILNPDVVLTPNWLAQGVDWMESHPHAGSLGGLLRRFTYSREELKTVEFSDIIDSAGLHGFRSRHFVDRGAGLVDRGQFGQPEQVFGLSGACVLFRREALESIRWKNEFFDEDFFGYKEDIDLAWRLQRQGWEAWFVPRLVAYHHRHIQGAERQSTRAIIHHHRSRDRMIAAYSYRNHWLLLLKHESAQTWLRDWPWILAYELKKLAFTVIQRPSNLSVLISVIRLFPRMRQKAHVMNHQAKQPSIQVRRWFLR